MIKGGIIGTVALILAAGLSLSYMVMCVFWLVTGCKFGARVCVGVFAKAALPCVMLVCLAEAVWLIISVRKIKNLERFYDEQGASDEYFARLEKYLTRKSDEAQSGLLKLAGAYAANDRLEDCFSTLERMDISQLSAIEQGDYFNMLVFGKLMAGEFQQAQTIYDMSRHYFHRALKQRKCGYILHTLGVLEYARGEYGRAETYFQRAYVCHGAGEMLKCECDLYLGLCELRFGRKELAKAHCECAAGEVSDEKQQAELEKLMALVERAYMA